MPATAQRLFFGRCRPPATRYTAVTDDLLQLLHAVLLIVGALLPVVNPPGNVPIFLNLTQGCDETTRRDLARHIAFSTLALLLGSMLLGQLVLRLFDLSVGALQVAGGAVVCALGWNLLHYVPKAEETQADPEQARQVALGRAFYPLTLPVSVDAGVIAVAITLGAHHGQTLTGELIQLLAAAVGRGRGIAAAGVPLCRTRQPLDRQQGHGGDAAAVGAAGAEHRRADRLERHQVAAGRHPHRLKGADA